MTGSRVVLLLLGALAAAAVPVSGQTTRRSGPTRAGGGAPLQVSITSTRIQFDVDRPLAQAAGGGVSLTVKYAGQRDVASVQFAGLASYPLGTHAGSFSQTLPNADIRAIMRADEAAILSRCVSTLDHHGVESIETVYDARLPVTVNSADGAIVDSITVPYQLGITCRRIPPLSVAIGHATVEFSIARPLAQAGGGLVSMVVKYNGTGTVGSVQVPGSLSYPIQARAGSFEETLPNADIRAIIARDESAIRERCQSSLDHNRVDVIRTVHDTRLTVTVNAPDGTVIASTTLPYQLGLTCTR